MQKNVSKLLLPVSLTSENKYSTKSAGGFDQLDKYDITLLAHELTHKIQQQSAGYQEAVSLHSKNVKNENRYGVNERTLTQTELNYLKQNPSYFIGKETTLKNMSGGFVSMEQRADINRCIMSLKYSHLFEAGV